MKKINKQHQERLLSRSFLFVACTLLYLSAVVYPQVSQERDRGLLLGSSPIATRRIALVIGNGSYTQGSLKNPPNDARGMETMLKQLGFEVTIGVNVNQREMKRLIRAFGQQLRVGGQGLFYYAGHGIQARGHNYLIPIDVLIENEADLEDSGVDLNLVLNYMDHADNGFNIVIMDACRNNPFARSFRSLGDGLAHVEAPTGTLIAYATAPGKVAADGPGENSVYTSELLKAMRIPGLSAPELFMRVRAEVIRRTNRQQVPWESSSLVGAFYFNVDGSKLTPSKLLDVETVEAEYWENIRVTGDRQDFQSYLEEYPNGRYASLARERIRRLEGGIKPEAIDGTEKVLPSEASSYWIKFESALGWMSVLMPIQPKEEKKTTATPYPSYTSTMYTARVTGHLYLVGWVDYEPSFVFNTDKELEANRDNMVKAVKGKLLTSNKITLDTYQGLSFTGEFLVRDRQFLFKARVFIVGKRPYMLTYVFPQGEESIPNGSRFFASFKITPQV